jgi:hypothetical protein
MEVIRFFNYNPIGENEFWKGNCDLGKDNENMQRIGK